MMDTLALPRVAGTRWAAEQVAADLPASLAGVTVTIDATETLSAAQGFCDQLLVEVIDHRDAAELTVTGGTVHMRTYLREAAERRGVADRIRFA